MKKVKYSNSRLLLNQKGFSLIELIIILIIIGIMIAASSSRLKDITTNARVGASINQITGDIDQAKTISMSMRSQIQIIFNQNNETYTIYKDGILYNDFPGSENGIVNLLVKSQAPLNFLNKCCLSDGPKVEEPSCLRAAVK